MSNSTEIIICPKCHKPIAEVTKQQSGGFGLETVKEISLHCQCNETVVFFVFDQLNGNEMYRDLTQIIT